MQRTDDTWIKALRICLGLFALFQVADSIQENNMDIFYRRNKRLVNCDDKYKFITSEHSACLPPSIEVRDFGISDLEKRIILDIHNTVRREVTPAATNMMLMTWDDEIANTAQRWAEYCEMENDASYKRYDFGRFKVGQNILISDSLKLDWSEVIRTWLKEQNDYDFDHDTSRRKGNVVDHYTQMIWSRSSKIGCGYAQCWLTHMYVCNYGPGGNTGGEKPYEDGVTCAKCPGHCNNGLCDCNGLVCLNGGELDLNTCTCDCKDDLPFFLIPSCGLNCTNISDPSWCTEEYKPSACETVAYIPQECPVMCNWCPYAAYKSDDEPVMSSEGPLCSALHALLWMTTVLIGVFC